MNPMRFLSISALVLGTMFVPWKAPAQSANNDLKIFVLEGEDGVNIIKDKTAVKPVVEVRDKNDLPVAGALVYFVIPKGGAGGTFANGERTISVMTDSNGRAVASAIKPAGKGSFDIDVRASYQGRTATTTIRQTNFQTVAQAQQAGKTPGSSQSANSAGSASSGSSGTATVGASSVAGGAGGAGGGMSALAVAGIVGGVAAGAGAAYYVKKQQEEQSGPNCTNEANQMISAYNNFIAACNANLLDQRCQGGGQNVLDLIGRVCSCVGSFGLDAQTRSYFQQVVDALQQVGFNTSSYASCGR